MDKKMKKFWISWWTDVCEVDGIPFEYWITGYRGDADTCSICAIINTNSEDQAWEIVGKYFPDYEERFCDEKGLDFNPGDRFPGPEEKLND